MEDKANKRPVPQPLTALTITKEITLRNEDGKPLQVSDPSGGLLTGTLALGFSVTGSEEEKASSNVCVFHL